MWWQYLIMALISIFAALLAVYVAHRLSKKYEYRKAKESVRGEIAANIETCYFICGQIDGDLDLPEGKWGSIPFQGFCESAWSTWKSVILVKNSELASKIDAAYFYIPTANKLLQRIEEFKWGSVGVIVDLKEKPKGHLEHAKSFILEILLPRLKAARELLEKESEKSWKRWLKRHS